MTNANDQSRLDQTGSMVAPEPGGASGQVGGDAARAGATAPAPLAGSPRTPDMPDDIRQHVCVTAAQAAPSAGTTRAERLALKELAISGKPFGPGSHTEHEGKTMTGAQAIIASLEAEGVDTLFGYPGGQAIKIYDALYDSTKIRHILARHEQGAVHEADGYARATGKVGVVLVTSGPGATNTVTGIATAYMDSVPLVVITGQVTRGVIGTDAFQEADIVGITMPVVKHSFLLQSTDDLTKTFREAFYIASTGRPGPVLIDIPSDLAGAQMVFRYPDHIDIPSYRPNYRGNAKQVKQAVEYIRAATRPLLMVGGGVVSSHACDEVVELAEKMQIPVVTTLLGKAAMPCSNPLNLGPVGMHGSKYANMAVTECDLLIAVGARFSDRVTGKLSEFAPHAKVIHIDIDPAEIGKNRTPDVPIVGDVKTVLSALMPRIERQHAIHGKPNLTTWWGLINSWVEKYPLTYQEPTDGTLAPQWVVEELSHAANPETIWVSGVGQHQMWATQFINFSHPHQWISSGGLGTMGFGLPAAIGASIGSQRYFDGKKPVWLIDGDGSFQMTSEELAAAFLEGAPVKIALLNNSVYGMVRQWQTLFYNNHYSATILHEEEKTGLEGVPDFVKLADAYGCVALRARTKDEAVEAIRRANEINDRPVLVDFRVWKDAMVWPMVAAGDSNDNVTYLPGIKPLHQADGLAAMPVDSDAQADEATAIITEEQD